MEFEEAVREAANLVSKSNGIVVLTGAGVSVDSGIPAFRGYQGIWEKYDPMEFGHIDSFLSDPGKVWKMLGELFATFFDSEPNRAHMILGELEKLRKVKAIITQNIDGLHQRAGSRRVIEYHGSGSRLVCISCGKRFKTYEKIKEKVPPECDCGRILKPDVVFYGEPVPEDTRGEAVSVTLGAGLFMVIGTSATAFPANQLPLIAMDRGVSVIVINPERSFISDFPGTLWVDGTAGESLTEIMKIAGIHLDLN